MILLIGASASGKTEVSKALRISYGIVKAITHTTRAPRKGEINDVDYHFVTEEEFLNMEKRDCFVETTFYNGHHYGCSKAEIADDKCVIVDPNGMKAFLSLKDPSIVSFYLEATEENRRKRMKSRGDSPEIIESRILNDRVSFSKEKTTGADFSIVTDDKDIKQLAKDIYQLYLKELKKRGINNPNIVVH